jgi:replicative superfamily II helicase
LAYKRKFGYIITDSSLIYGVNLPLTSVVIEDELLDYSSLGNIFQLMGRAGRVG